VRAKIVPTVLTLEFNTGLGPEVVPVFVFDVSLPHFLLLDKTFQAVSFPDMVVAVQTPQASIALDYR
jgi:hypothetical protein